MVVVAAAAAVVVIPRLLLSSLLVLRIIHRSLTCIYICMYVSACYCIFIHIHRDSLHECFYIYLSRCSMLTFLHVIVRTLCWIQAHHVV